MAQFRPEHVSLSHLSTDGPNWPGCIRKDPLQPPCRSSRSWRGLRPINRPDYGCALRSRSGLTTPVSISPSFVRCSLSSSIRARRGRQCELSTTETKATSPTTRLRRATVGVRLTCKSTAHPRNLPMSRVSNEDVGSGVLGSSDPTRRGVATGVTRTIRHPRTIVARHGTTEDAILMFFSSFAAYCV